MRPELEEYVSLCLFLFVLLLCAMFLNICFIMGPMLHDLGSKRALQREGRRDLHRVEARGTRGSRATAHLPRSRSSREYSLYSFVISEVSDAVAYIAFNFTEVADLLQPKAHSCMHSSCT